MPLPCLSPRIMAMESQEIFTRPAPVRGIISIRNLRSGRMLLLATEDAVASFPQERFALDLGMHRARELQKDYEETGLELFSIDLDTEAGGDADLAALEPDGPDVLPDSVYDSLHVNSGERSGT